MSWTYEQYREQPYWLIQMLIQMLNAEAEQQKKENRKNG